MKRFLAITLALAMILSLLSGCGGNAGGGKSETAILSPETTSITTKDGVTVDVGEWVLDGEAELTVEPLAVEKHDDEGYQINAYDITLGDLTQLNDFITIRIPYDPSFCEDGEDASQCVGAKYKNESTGQWEDVLFEVDAEANELIIYTDHLSTYGAFQVKRAGQRNAYITDVGAGLDSIGNEMAMETLREYISNGGAPGDLAVNLATAIVTGYNCFLGTVADKTGEASFLADAGGLAGNMLSLGGNLYDSELMEEAFDNLSTLGQIAASVKLGASMLKTDKSNEDVLNIFKDSAMLALSFAKSKALGTAASALFVFDYTISEMFAQGMAMKHDKVNEVYLYYNEQFSGMLDVGVEWDARDLKEWRQAFIDIVEQNPDPDAAGKAIEAEIDRYARAFWALPDMEKGIVVTDMESKNRGQKNEVTIPDPNEAEKEKMVNDYKAVLYERLYPVLTSVSVYMQRKMEAEYLAALEELKAFYNQQITFSFEEELEAGAEPKYKGYVMRFEPLGEGVDPKTWTTSALGDQGATGQTSFSLIGFITAGAPDHLALYKPGDDPDNDEPELSLSFKLSAPVTEVKLGGLPLDELLGTYSVTFTYEGETETYNFTFMYDEGQLVFMPELEDIGAALMIQQGPYEYDPSTATATCETPDDTLSFSTHVRFISEEGAVRFSSDNIVEVVKEGRTVTVYGEGIKID